ncbi:hypothetical protein N9N67_06305 [Bacteriovoracaceae bacterium]|nr:hypothetical protein [Bacteriovoracaceae bacterium]
MAKSILVRIPDKLIDRIHSFPFLHKLNDYLVEVNKGEKHSLNIICAEKGIELLYLLPFSANYYPLKEDDLTNMFTMHRACHYFNFPKPDLFFNLTEETKDATVGLSMRIKDKVGFETSKTKWVLNHLFTYQNNLNRSDNFLSLLKVYLKTHELKMRTLEVRKLEVEKEIYPYIGKVILDLPMDPNNSEIIDQRFKDFLELIDPQDILLTCSSLELSQAAIQLEEFKLELAKKHQYKIYHYSDLIEVTKIIQNSKVYLGPNLSYINLASIVGTKCLAIFETKKKAQVFSPAYSKGMCQHYYLDELGTATSIDPLLDALIPHFVEAPKLEIVDSEE